MTDYNIFYTLTFNSLDLRTGHNRDKLVSSNYLDILR
jgi:hypothetical protein